MKLTIDDLVKYLKSDFPQMETYPDAISGHRYFCFRDKDVMLAFADVDFPHGYIAGNVCVECTVFFDKWSKSPVRLPIPETKEQRDYLYEKIIWLHTEEGREATKNYDVDKWIKDYPEELK